MTNSREVILECDLLSKNYGGKRSGNHAVFPLTRMFTSRRRYGIIGESGSGKSTVCRMLVGLERPSSGRVLWNGRDITNLARSEKRQFRTEVQHIAQDTSSSFDPRRTLLDSILQPIRRLTDLAERDARARAADTLRLLGLDPRTAASFPADVSGGQRQRFSIARALVVRPSVLICDEVVSALDVSVQGSILNLLTSYCSEYSAGIIFVSHGIPATAFVADQLLVMRSGEVIEAGTTTEVLGRPQHSYTQELLAAAT